jgi:HlyD family secretion protein
MVWSRRGITLALAGAALFGGLGYVALRDDPVPVDLVTVRAAPLQVTIDAEGQTRIRDIYEVAAPIAGTALRAPVAVGDRVQAGSSVVARVEPATPALLDARSRAEAEAALTEAEAALDLARAELTRAEEEEHFARQQSDRTRALVERGVASITRMESISQQLAVAEASVSAARARNAMAQGMLDRAEAALMGPILGGAPASCCIDLTAPADGVVLAIATISEHPVQAGAPLVSIGDPTDLEIVADLLSADAVRIAPGTRAIVERWGGPDPLAAVLIRMDPAARTRVSALGIEEQRVDAIFRIVTPADQRPRLGHGFAVFLRIVEWEQDNALQVPRGALFRRDEGWAVFVVEQGRARERPVTLGQRGARMAEVLEGLVEGEAIITHPGDAVRDGVAVRDRRAF